MTLSIPDYDAKVTAPASGTDVRVPFLDLARIHAPLYDVLAGEFEALMRSSAFVNGEPVRAFEAEFAAYCGASAAVGVASGLDALRLALAALDIGVGDEVIVPSMTFVATWEAVSQVGAVPVPVDITESDYNVDVGALAAAISHRTAAIIPVHLYGQMADMEGLVAVSAHAGIPLIEDAAQAHGAMRDGRRAGGSRGCFQLLSGEKSRCLR